MTILYIVTAKTLNLDNEDVNYIMVASCLLVDALLLVTIGNWVQDILPL